VYDVDAISSPDEFLVFSAGSSILVICGWQWWEWRCISISRHGSWTWCKGTDALCVSSMPITSPQSMCYE